MKSVTYFILTILCFVAGAPVEDERIIGGSIATAGQFPFIVSLTENNRHFCNGFIYNEKWIVTTASCVHGKTTSNMRAVVGQLDLTTVDSNEEIIPVFQIRPFEQYNDTYKLNDLALIQLTKAIDLSSPDMVNFIPYNEVDAENLKATAMGWGSSQDGAFESTKLRYADVDLLDSSAVACGGYTGVEFNRATMLCTTASSTGANPGAPCRYDEGSPLVQTISGLHTAVGIMSKNSGCALDSESVYTRISVYYAWFLNVAGPQPEIVNQTGTYEEAEQVEEAAAGEEVDEEVESAWPLQA